MRTRRWNVIKMYGGPTASFILLVTAGRDIALESLTLKIRRGKNRLTFLFIEQYGQLGHAGLHYYLWSVTGAKEKK